VGRTIDVQILPWLRQSVLGSLAGNFGLFLALTAAARQWMPPLWNAEVFAQVLRIARNAHASF
jgi:hypothetical protein